MQLTGLNLQAHTQQVEEIQGTLFSCGYQKRVTQKVFVVTPIFVLHQIYEIKFYSFHL